MTPEAFVLAVATTAASLGVPLEAVVSAPPSAAYSLDLQASATDTFAILEAAPPKVVILPLAVGRLPVSLKWRVEGQDKPVAGPPLVLDVAEPALDSPQIADIRPPLSARPRLWPWLLLLAAAAAGWWYWRRRRALELAEAAAEAALDRRPAHERALEALGALEALWGEGRRREFYFGLTDALRAYLERRYAIPATVQTTHELARALKSLGLKREDSSRLLALFARADLVKFADARPEDAWGPADLGQARDFVLKTAPPPAPEPQEAGA